MGAGKAEWAAWQLTRNRQPVAFFQVLRLKSDLGLNRTLSTIPVNSLPAASSFPKPLEDSQGFDVIVLQIALLC